MEAIILSYIDESKKWDTNTDVLISIIHDNI